MAFPNLFGSWEYRRYYEVCKAGDSRDLDLCDSCRIALCAYNDATLTCNEISVELWAGKEVAYEAVYGFMIANVVASMIAYLLA